MARNNSETLDHFINGSLNDHFNSLIQSLILTKNNYKGLAKFEPQVVPYILYSIF